MRSLIVYNISKKYLNKRFQYLNKPFISLVFWGVIMWDVGTKYGFNSKPGCSKGPVAQSGRALGS